MLKVIILAAGQGFRLGEILPKCLLKVGKFSILEHQVCILKKNNQASFLDQLQTLIKEN